MVEEIPGYNLPSTWADFDLASFSREKVLWDYQQQALLNAIKALWKYYEDFGDYRPGEGEDANRQRKRRFWRWYQSNGLKEDFSLNFSLLNHALTSMLSEYYEPEEGRLSYESFINRMSFWMATGSGKTLVIVKLIEILARLIQRNEVPPL